MAQEGVDGYFGVRRENTRYLTGFELGEGEEKVAGNSGQFLVGRNEVVVFADSRYTLSARQQTVGAESGRSTTTCSRAGRSCSRASVR